MVSIGSTGSLGNEWSLKDNRRAALSSLYGQDISFNEAVSAFGIDVNKEIDTIAAEVKFSGNDIDSQFDLLDFDERVFNNNDCIFKSSDGKAYTDFDLKNGTYAVNSEQQFASSLGIDYSDENSKQFDFIKLENNAITVTDMVFTNSADGQNDKLRVDLTKLNDLKWNNVTYNIQSTGENNVNCIKDTVPDYIVAQIKSKLGNLKEGTDEYNKRFLDEAAKLMDQEGYTKGNKLSEPENTELTQSAKNFDVVREDNGRVRILLNSKDEVNVEGAGKINGSAILSLGATADDKKESVVQVGNLSSNSELNISVSDKARNLQVFGNKVKADFKSSLASYYNINWAANSGKLNAIGNKSTLFIESAGSDNEFELDGDAYIIDDNESNNIFKWKYSTIENK